LTKENLMIRASLGDLDWVNDGFILESLHFIQDWSESAINRAVTYPDFILMKSRDNVETYIRVLSESRIAFSNVLELGIMRGGSCAFFNTLLAPRHHLAIDICQRESGLAHFAQSAVLDGRKFVPRYDVSQTETDRIARLFSEIAGSDAVFDLIIDDASHDYDMTLKAFNGLFPLLRPGGIYAVEDWGWAHWGPWQDPNHPSFSSPAMSNLVFLAALSCTSRGPGAISRVEVTPVTTFVFRGQDPIEPGFAVEHSYLARGRSLTLL
jgi:SAM-dependent methyltransferase